MPILKLIDRATPLLFFVALVIVWQVALQIFPVPSFILPSPSQIFIRMAEAPGRMVVHLLATLHEIIVGFSCALIGGVALAVMTAHSHFLARTLYPLLVVSQTIPTVAIAPLLVIWFGPGETARIIVVFLISFFPIFVNTTAGLLRVNEDFVYLVRGLNASNWRIFTKIRFPNAMPSLFTGMRISIALSVIGAVVAEFVAANQGLGYLVFSASTNMDTRLVFAAVVVLATLGIILFQLVRLAQAWALPWAAAAGQGDA
jgi:NitT/TauT family transport system permease protein